MNRIAIAVLEGLDVVIGNVREKAERLAPGHAWRVRVDVINVADRTYELRDGTGVGVNAAQYGQRFGLFGSAGYLF